MKTVPPARVCIPATPFTRIMGVFCRVCLPYATNANANANANADADADADAAGLPGAHARVRCG
ncbi:hypothetical protein [Komagataeibacter nataicola]|uniref:hypothetical protein n=1 Tax=Komagataeibacter nataicola TaxID=265960 RepID=UPI00125DACE1|nr:hypothetical protein [Komagataeibacter nataicola]